MCGIHGLLSLRDPPRNGAEILQRMGRVTRHRGPDDEGARVDGPMLLGMRRLSIIDVAGGHQPIGNESGDVWVVCNGEIYNFRELRADLIARGHRFSTGSDSEVAVHLYEEFGDEFVSRLDGMFALALWDGRRRRLLLARDCLGIKPLYYCRDERQLAFASEAKSLLTLPGVSAALDREALGEYLSLGYVPAPASIFSGIRKLPPASLLIAEEGRVAIRQYWRLSAQVEADRSDAEWAERVLAALDRAVHAQMVSDVPLGAFLSGGIDSSAVVALMSRHSDRPVRTYSIGFQGSSGAALFNELPHARRVADAFGTEHHEILVAPDVVELLPRLLWHMDEPVADSAFVTTYLVSEFARRDVKVILSGVGGDELFGGYTRYLEEDYRRIYHRVPAWVRRNLLTPVARHLPSDRHGRWLNRSRLLRSFLLADELSFEERYHGYMQVFDAAQCQRLMGGAALPADAVMRALAQVRHGDGLRRLMEVDLLTQLPDDLLHLTDRMSMATSLECRVPLLDRSLVELAARMPAHLRIRNGRLKHVLRRALSGVLPQAVLEREKRGFGAPMGAWLKAELASLLDQVLSQESLRRRGLFDADAVRELRAAHAANRADHTDHLLALLNFELWARIYLDGRSHEDVAVEIRERRAA